MERKKMVSDMMDRDIARAIQHLVRRTPKGEQVGDKIWVRTGMSADLWKDLGFAPVHLVSEEEVIPITSVHLRVPVEVRPKKFENRFKLVHWFVGEYGSVMSDQITTSPYLTDSVEIYSREKYLEVNNLDSDGSSRIQEA